jgi:hypothetical protein
VFSDTGDLVCELDEYSQLVHELKKSGIIRDHSRMFGLMTVKKSFTGKDFVDWVVFTKGLGTLFPSFLYKCIGRIKKKMDWKMKPD